MKVFIGSHRQSAEQTTLTSALSHACRALQSLPAGEELTRDNASCTISTQSTRVGSQSGQTFVADDEAEFHRFSLAYDHLKKALGRLRGELGRQRMLVHFLATYDYQHEATIESIGLGELMVREAMCIGLGIIRPEERRLVFALDGTDLTRVLERVEAHRTRGIMQALRDLGIQLNSARR